MGNENTKKNERKTQSDFERLVREAKGGGHCLKTWIEYYQEVLTGKKKFEIRKNDRNFKVGDTLILQEYNKITGQYTGEMIAMKVDYLTDFAQKDNFVVMSISPCSA